MYTYIRVDIYNHTYIYIYAYIYIYIYTCIYIYIYYTYIYIYTYVPTYLHTYTHIHTYIHTYIHTDRQFCKNIYLFAHTYTGSMNVNWPRTCGMGTLRAARDSGSVSGSGFISSLGKLRVYIRFML